MYEILEAESHASKYKLILQTSFMLYLELQIVCKSLLFIIITQSQKNMKETVWRAKRLTREMQSYWKRYDRVERETRRRLEKEAEEQRKMDVELIEVWDY